MGQNKIQAFATNSSANVLTDEALASRSEMQTGFPLKSKADSALVGKLIQNATAGAYAVAEFTSKNSDSDISGSDPTGFATAFESALESYVNEKAPSPDLTQYLTKTEASSNYAPLANPALTGTATLNGQNVATVNQIPDVSHFVTDTAIQGYAPLTGAVFTGAVTVQEPTTANNPATKQYVDSAVSSVYKYRGSVANQSALPISDQTIGDVYNVEDTGDNFAWDGTQWDKLAGTVDLSSYLTISSAQATYQPKGDYATNTALSAKADASALANYAPLANPALTGTATLNGNTIATVNQIPDTSTFATKTELSNYLPKAGGTVSEFSVAGSSIPIGLNVSESTATVKLEAPGNSVSVTSNGVSVATGSAGMLLNNKQVATVDQIPTITSGTEDLQAGVSELATGALYFVYE